MQCSAYVGRGTHNTSRGSDTKSHNFVLMVEKSYEIMIIS